MRRRQILKEQENALMLSKEMLKMDLSNKGICTLCKISIKQFDELTEEVFALRTLKKRTSISKETLDGLSTEHKKRGEALNKEMKELIEKIKLFKDSPKVYNNKKLIANKKEHVVNKNSQAGKILEKIRKSKDEHINTDEGEDC